MSDLDIPDYVLAGRSRAGPLFSQLIQDGGYLFEILDKEQVEGFRKSWEQRKGLGASTGSEELIRKSEEILAFMSSVPAGSLAYAHLHKALISILVNTATADYLEI